MDIYTQILQAFGIKDYDDLRPDEQDTIKKWVDQVEKSVITIEDVKRGVVAMREAVEQGIVDEPEYIYVFIFKIFNRKHVFLKARLKNLLLLEAILTRPERARSALESYINKAKIGVK